MRIQWSGKSCVNQTRSKRTRKETGDQEISTVALDASQQALVKEMAWLRWPANEPNALIVPFRIEFVPPLSSTPSKIERARG